MNSRREFLVQGATVAMVGAVSGSQVASAASDRTTALAQAGSPLNPAQASKQHLAKMLLAKNWADLKIKLQANFKEQESEPHYEIINKWLNTFTNKTISEQEIEVVKRAGDGIYVGEIQKTLIYEPQLVEFLLEGIGRLLDRCLAYRQELAELEIAGIKAATEYVMFLRVNSIDMSMLDDALQDQQAGVLANAFDNAAQQFKKSDDALGKGFESESSGQANAYRITAEKEVRRKKGYAARNGHIKAANHAMFTRLVSPGNAHNYAERFERVFRFFSEDLSEAYQKAYCAALGLKSVYRIDNVIPLFNSSSSETNVNNWIGATVGRDVAYSSYSIPDAIDALVTWTRNAMRDIERISQYEVEYTVPIPITLPWHSASSTKPPGASDSLVGQDVFDNAMKPGASGKVEFLLSPEMFPIPSEYQPMTRIIGIGAAVATVPDISGHGRYSVLVQPPPQKSPLGSTTYSRPPTLLSNVKRLGGPDLTTDPEIARLSTCHNIDPFFSGKWAITVDWHIPNMAGVFPSSRDVGRPKDVWLFFRVVSRLKIT